MGYMSFEELPVWQDARVLTSDIYNACSVETFRNDFDLMRQIRRASTSISLNIAEGFERKSKKDFARFINQAKASAGEVRCILYLASDLKYLSKGQVEHLMNKIQSISRQLGKFQKHLLNKA